LVDHQNDYIERLNINNNAKSFNILAISL